MSAWVGVGTCAAHKQIFLLSANSGTKSRGAFDPRINFVAQHLKIDWFGEKRLGAALHWFAQLWNLITKNEDGADHSFVKEITDTLI